MTKETISEKVARTQLETAQRNAVAKATYHDRVMSVMARAQAVNFELTVRNLSFELYDRDERYCTLFVLESVYSSKNDDALQSFELEVSYKEEAAHKFLAKRAALAKLSKEERELLGV